MGNLQAFSLGVAFGALIIGLFTYDQHVKYSEQIADYTADQYKIDSLQVQVHKMDCLTVSIANHYDTAITNVSKISIDSLLKDIRNDLN